MRRWKPSKFAGYDADTLARMKASNDNLAGIIEGRRRAARLLLARDPRPAQTVYDDTAALLPGDPPPATTGLASWVPIGAGGPGGPVAFVGEGAPVGGNAPAGAAVGDFYLDELTGDYYQLTT